MGANFAALVVHSLILLAAATTVVVEILGGTALPRPFVVHF